MESPVLTFGAALTGVIGAGIDNLEDQSRPGFYLPYAEAPPAPRQKPPS